MKFSTTNASISTVALLLALCMSPVVYAQMPSQISVPYEEYQQALEAKDFDAARNAAKTAWDAAEETLGDTKLTGDLAFNYGFTLNGLRPAREQAEALQRSMDLVDGHGADAGATYLERGLARIMVLRALGDTVPASREAVDLVKYGQENNLTKSTFYAEAMTLVAAAHIRNGNEPKAKLAAEAALDAFANADDGIESAYELQAQLYKGYGLEKEERFLDAALSYQVIVEALADENIDRVPLRRIAVGRWIFMRSAARLANPDIDFDEAGICSCWPYHDRLRENVEPLKRKTPTMPRKAQQSGYVIVGFDLDETGTPINETVITAWPDYYERPALKALSRWKYTPKTPEQSESDRTGLVTTVQFRLTDSKGNMIW